MTGRTLFPADVTQRNRKPAFTLDMVRLLSVILLQGCYLKTATDCTNVYFILSSVFYVIVAICQLYIKDFLILILTCSRIQVSRTSNLYPSACRRIRVDGL